MNILNVVGNTPVVEMTNLNGNPRVRILGKLEGNNPGGSVKDRPAYYMIKKAEETGELTKEKIIIEPTSGNTGIALAMIGAAKGYRVKLFMPEKCSGSLRNDWPRSLCPKGETRNMQTLDASTLATLTHRTGQRTETSMLRIPEN